MIVFYKKKALHARILQRISLGSLAAGVRALFVIILSLLMCLLHRFSRQVIYVPYTYEFMVTF